MLCKEFRTKLKEVLEKSTNNITPRTVEKAILLSAEKVNSWIMIRDKVEEKDHKYYLFQRMTIIDGQLDKDISPLDDDLPNTDETLSLKVICSGNSVALITDEDVYIWSLNPEMAEVMKELGLKLKSNEYTIPARILTLLDSRVYHLTSTISITEQFHKEAYPFIDDPEKLFEDFLNANASILFLAGPPGTGKTRLIRWLLKYYASKRKPGMIVLTQGSDVRLFRAAITTVIEDYVHGISRARSKATIFLVLEDLDEELTERTAELESLLSLTDGVLQLPVKVIITTNRSRIKLNDIDPALIRPGRTFAILETRLLSPEEANKLAKQLKINQTFDREVSLAEIYNEQLKVQHSNKLGFA